MELPSLKRIFARVFFGIAVAVFLLSQSLPALLATPIREKPTSVVSAILQKPDNVNASASDYFQKNAEPAPPPAEDSSLSKYIEVSDGCGPYFDGECLNARSGPGTNYGVVLRLRNGMVLKVGSVAEADGEKWYKIIFDEALRYPERVQGDMYVSADYVRIFSDAGEQNPTGAETAENKKRIVVNRGKQMLGAYDGDELFMETKISTGIELSPTPRGKFNIYKKTPTRYMQGPLPGISDQYYDLPGVPWNLYFTPEGAVIHGAYWHDKFGQPWSHGCVNVPLGEAKKLYNWADVGTEVIVQD